MSLTTTLAIFAVLIAITVFAGWRGSRPPNFVKGPRLMPWRPIMIATATGAAIMGGHAAVLVGLVTKQP